ncbi:MAG: tetratricopeptide repeat protein [Bacteroidetes bacterium]|nr:MAG: tetratricopeptide repeat protein [Bacteroidota bacterium]
MKKILILIWLIAFTGIVTGQQAVDYIMRAKSYSEAGNNDSAIKLLSEALAILKESRLYSERAEVNTLKGDYSAAISDYSEANKLTSSSGEYGLSRIYALKGDASTALYHLELNLKSTFRKAEKEIMLDPAFGPIENSPQWRQFWKKEWYSDSEKRISEIEYNVSTGRIEESKTLLTELKKSYGSNDDILYAEASINLASGKYPEVVRITSGLIAVNPYNEKYLRMLANAQTASSNPAGASVTYSQLIGSGVADAELLIQRAECYKKTGENDKAMKDLEKYLDIYPGNRVALSLAGKVETAAGDNLKALEYFSKNLKIHPGDAECYTDRANSYFASRSWDWAINDYSMSLDLKPANPEVWLNKGIALLNTGKVEEACHDFRRSFSLGNKRASEYISRECIK